MTQRSKLTLETPVASSSKFWSKIPFFVSPQGPARPIFLVLPLQPQKWRFRHRLKKSVFQPFELKFHTESIGVETKAHIEFQTLRRRESGGEGASIWPKSHFRIFGQLALEGKSIEFWPKIRFFRIVAKAPNIDFLAS